MAGTLPIDGCEDDPLQKNIIGHILAIVTEAIFPGICCGCGRIYKIAQQGFCNSEALFSEIFFEVHMRAFLCPQCRRQFQAIVSPLCLQCGKPFQSANAIDHLCSQCQSEPASFQWVRAVGLYEGGLRLAIQHYKYRRADRMAQPLGYLLWKILCDYEHPTHFDHVIPVPLHSRRLRWRGFNQAQLLIRQWPAIAAQENITIAHDWIAPGILKRHRPTIPQTGLNKSQRNANLLNAFQLVDGKDISGARVLLVDDVLTTGATANACARVLLKAGAEQVSVITLARAVH